MRAAEKTPDPVPEGECFLCGKTLSNRGLARHVRACRDKRSPQGAKAKGLATHSICLSVQGSALHWLHLEADAASTLADLDAFLRHTWLECCGHMSEFLIGGERYAGGGGGGYDELESRSLDIPLQAVLEPGMTFTHSYDFGSTTELKLRVAAKGAATVKRGRIEIQARNRPPSFPCKDCGQPAAEICTECSWSEAGWLCAACAKTHDCGEEMLLPVVNSPRVGVCGYTG